MRNLQPPVVAMHAVAMHTEPMTPSHAEQVLAIYHAGIDEGSEARLPDHRYVAVAAPEPGDGGAGPGGLPAGAVLGWVAVSPVSSRCAYAGVVEHSVYVHPASRGRGVGRLLLSALIASTEAAGIWTIQSGVFPENVASIALHRSAGFRVVGTRERIGRHHGRWRDILLLERRSPVIG